MAPTKLRELKQGQFTETLGAVPLELVMDSERFSNGWMIMTIASVDVKERGQEAGSVRFSITGDSVHISIGKRTWAISSKELWLATVKADERYLYLQTRKSAVARRRRNC